MFAVFRPLAKPSADLADGLASACGPWPKPRSAHEGGVAGELSTSEAVRGIHDHRDASAFLPSRGGCPPAFLYPEVFVREISVFVDESGGQDGQSRYYALTLVFHDQDRPIDEMVARHRKGLRDRGLEDLPFHAGPILNGHKEYENMDFATRKSYFMLFFLTLQHLPVAYQTFVYRRSEVGGKDAFVNRMRRA